MNYHTEVCPLSREVTFKPLSVSLQNGIRFFCFLIPALLSVDLTGNFPAPAGALRAYHVPHK